MAAVYQDIKLAWKGEEYSIRPTMRLMQDIEQRFSISRVAHRITKGDVPLSHMAAIIAMMLKSAGAEDVTEDDVFAELLGGDSQAVQEMAIALITAAFPVSAEAGNATAPAKAAKKATKK